MRSQLEPARMSPWQVIEKRGLAGNSTEASLWVDHRIAVTPDQFSAIESLHHVGLPSGHPAQRQRPCICIRISIGQGDWDRASSHAAHPPGNSCCAIYFVPACPDRRPAAEPHSPKIIRPLVFPAKKKRMKRRKINSACTHRLKQTLAVLHFLLRRRPLPTTISCRHILVMDFRNTGIILLDHRHRIHACQR